MSGRRTSLASLAVQRVEDVPGRNDPTLINLSPKTIVPTPLNKRTNFGTHAGLVELGESMRRRQLQPIVIVSRASYLKIFPEDAEHVDAATYVIANGERRWRGSNVVELPTIEAVIREEVAASRQDFLDAVASENLDRKNLDPIEEAHTVEALVEEFGSARAVAVHRGKHETWVSQRRSLLRLSPEMQRLVSLKEMPVESARKLAKAIKDHELSYTQQAEWWVTEQLPAPKNLTAVKSDPANTDTDTGDPKPDDPPKPVPPGPENLTAVKSDPANTELPLPWGSPAAIEQVLREHMTSENLATLAKLLRD